jgi:hypothetical protein
MRIYSKQDVFQLATLTDISRTFNPVMKPTPLICRKYTRGRTLHILLINFLDQRKQMKSLKGAFLDRRRTRLQVLGVLLAVNELSACMEAIRFFFIQF